MTVMYLSINFNSFLSRVSFLITLKPIQIPNRAPNALFTTNHVITEVPVKSSALDTDGVKK